MLMTLERISQYFGNTQKNFKEFEFDVTVKSKCFGEPTTRLITEAVLICLIDKLSDTDSLWIYVRLPRAVIVH